MPNVQVTRDVWRGESDAEGSLRQWLSVLLIPRLEVALRMPPVVMRRLDLDRVVSGGW